MMLEAFLFFKEGSDGVLSLDGAAKVLLWFTFRDRPACVFAETQRVPQAYLQCHAIDRRDICPAQGHAPMAFPVLG